MVSLSYLAMEIVCKSGLNVLFLANPTLPNEGNWNVNRTPSYLNSL